MGQFKDKILNEYVNAPFKVGEVVNIKASLIDKYVRKENEDKLIQVVIRDVQGDKVFVQCEEGYNAITRTKDIVETNIENITKYTHNIGNNPFKNIGFWRKLNKYQYDLFSILARCGIRAIDEKPVFDNYKINGHVIQECNDNPFIIDNNGNKQYYQRGYVWSLKDEQNFIESIYNSLDCGKIVLRRRSWKYIEDKANNNDTEGLAFFDVVDGKQRIHTLKRFLNDEFADLEGHYYSDLSERAKMYFESSESLTYLELGEESTDEDVLKTFLMINFAGKPMSKEHLEFVENIYKNS